LDFSQIENNVLVLKKEIFNLSKTLSFLHNLFSRKIQEKKDVEFGFQVKLGNNFKNEEDMYVYGDALRFQQVIINFLSNAFKYTDKGKVLFQITGDFDNFSNEIILKIEITDTGCGIPESDIENIFLPFYQINRLSSSGAGLGLFFVSEILKQMKSKIKCESKLNQGSKFTISDLRFQITSNKILTSNEKKKYKLEDGKSE